MKQHCRCHHSAESLRHLHPPQQYVVVDGEYQLICTVCGCLWDHAATDRLIDLVMKGASAAPDGVDANLLPQASKPPEGER